MFAGSLIFCGISTLALITELMTLECILIFVAGVLTVQVYSIIVMPLPTILGGGIMFPSHRTIVRQSVNIYFAGHDISLLSGGI